MKHHSKHHALHKKHGGKAKKHKAYGGKIDVPYDTAPGLDEKERKELAPVTGGKARLRLDRPGRKRGGRVGADMAPIVTAGRTGSESDGGPD